MIVSNINIARIRAEKGYTQEELAKVCEISRSSVIKAEKGHSISPTTWRKIKTVLQL